MQETSKQNLRTMTMIKPLTSYGMLCKRKKKNQMNYNKFKKMLQFIYTLVLLLPALKSLNTCTFNLTNILEK